MEFFVTYLLPIIIPMILGAVVMPIMQGLKKASDWVEARPSWMKQGIVGILALGATLAAPVLGIPISPDILGMNGEAITAVLTAVFALLTHKFTRPAA